MNEIEKMYENAEINKREIENCTYKNSTPCGHSCDDGEDCPYLEIKEDYPPFTAEKQIELIKFLTKDKKILRIELRIFQNEFCITRCTPCKTNPNAEYITTGRIKQFEQALAELINSLWQDLTEEEKEQIKEILK